MSLIMLGDGAVKLLSCHRQGVRTREQMARHSFTSTCREIFNLHFGRYFLFRPLWISLECK